MERTDFKFDEEASRIAEMALLGKDIKSLNKDLKKKKHADKTPVAQNDDDFDAPMERTEEDPVEEWELVEIRAKFQREPDVEFYDADEEDAEKDVEFFEDEKEDVELSVNDEEDVEEWKKTSMRKDAEAVEKAHTQGKDVEKSGKDVEKAKYAAKDGETKEVKSNGDEKGKGASKDGESEKIKTKNIESAMGKSKDVAKCGNDVEIAKRGSKDVEETKSGAQNVEDRDEKDIKKEIAQSGYSLGKFKNPEELLKAYIVLEKEFTRRSQRLKELERSVAPYASEEEWRDAADKFFKKTPSAKLLAREMAQEIALDPTLKEGRDCFDRALLRALVKCYRTPEQLMSDGQFLKDYVLTSDVVRRAVIESYLEEMSAGVPPITLPGGGQCSAAPTLRPRSVREAGDMLLRENK